MHRPNGVKRTLAVLLCCTTVLAACYAGHELTQQQASAASADAALAGFTRDWRDHDIWHDGKAETCLYDGTRTIYGVTRKFEAIVHTNKERYSTKTKTKSDGAGVEVFKHHIVEVIPTESYDYKFSTMVYVKASDLSPVKIDMGSQEECGASFKQFVAAGGDVTYHQFSYFPNEGHREGEFDLGGDVVFQDGLSIVLRGYPFGSPRDVPVALLADQTTTKWSPTKPADGYVVRYIGRETLDLPIGKVAAHHVRVLHPRDGSQPVHDYWFAASGDAVGGMAQLHVMVQYEGPDGMSYRLRSQQRGKYWQR